MGYLGGAIAMLLASVNNILLTVGYILVQQLSQRTWGRPSRTAFKARASPVLVSATCPCRGGSRGQRRCCDRASRCRFGR